MKTWSSYSKSLRTNEEEFNSNPKKMRDQGERIGNISCSIRASFRDGKDFNRQIWKGRYSKQREF